MFHASAYRLYIDGYAFCIGLNRFYIGFVWVVIHFIALAG